MPNACWFSRLFGISAALALSGCAVAREPAEEEYKSNVLRFTVDQPVGGEGFICVQFERPELAGKTFRGIRWEPPADQNMQLHHATTFTISNLDPYDKLTCSQNKGSAHLHAWASGGDLFEFPPGFGIRLPDDLNRFDISTHMLRLAAGPPQTATAILDISDEPPEHAIGTFMPSAIVPTIPPHETATAVGHCVMDGAAHAIGVWPHLHTAGKELRSEVIRASGAREPLLHIKPWDFHGQQIHALDVDLYPGDKIETTCTWENPTPEPILPGNLASNEMCVQIVFAYPPEEARCSML